MADLTGKLAIVTGAGRGAGRAIALKLARAGAVLVVVDVNPDAAARAGAAITADGGRAEAQVVDVGNKLAVQTMLYTVLEAHPQLDILVNAAQITPRTEALRLDEGEWNRTLDVNLKGAFLVSQTVARAMRETGGGVILNVIRRAEPQAAVRAARDGLLGLTAALAAEWAPLGVRVESLEHGQDAEATAAEALRRITPG